MNHQNEITDTDFYTMCDCNSYKFPIICDSVMWKCNKYTSMKPEYTCLGKHAWSSTRTKDSVGVNCCISMSTFKNSPQIYNSHAGPASTGG